MEAPMGDLYRPTLDTVDDVRAWISSWNELGGFPHPDDSAWLTCEEQDRLGYGRYHAKEPSHDEGGHISIVGPAAPKTKEDALAYDASKRVALAILDEAGVDIYTLITDARDAGEDDAVVITVRLAFRPDEVVTTLDREDVVESLKARLDEVYVGPNNWPITPEVTILD